MSSASRGRAANAFIASRCSGEAANTRGGRPPGLPLSPGTYLTLAALNRVVDPCSKRAFADWWRATAADRFTKIGASALEEEIFGKHVLITDHDDWPAAEVIAAYRSKSEAEFSFRQMKDPHAVSAIPYIAAMRAMAVRPSAGCRGVLWV